MPHEFSPLDCSNTEWTEVSRPNRHNQHASMIPLLALGLLLGCQVRPTALQPKPTGVEVRQAPPTAAPLVSEPPGFAPPPAVAPVLEPASTAGKLGIREGGLLVVAPHPDDEALIASGAILRAVESGEPVAVVILTSGDFDCVQSAETRQTQSVAGLAALGIQESQIFFLGYPDGSLSRLGDEALTPVRRLVAGTCERGNITYGYRGAGNTDVHKWLTGLPGSYTAPNLVSDLRFLIEELVPTTVIVTHPEDTHPDHAAAYAFVRRALAGSDRAPRILRAMVHSDDCWPTGENPDGSCAPGRIAPQEATPDLSGGLEGYVPDVRMAVPDSCLAPQIDDNPKLRAIASHRSETLGNPTSYLLSFARRDELFFSEELFRDSQGNWAPQPAPRSEEPSFWLQGRESRGAAQATPMALGVRLARPAPGAPVRVSFLESQLGSYRADFDGESLSVQLIKITPRSQPLLLKEWLLAHDIWQESQSLENFELQVAQRDPGAPWAELTLLHGDEVVGVAVDPQALSSGDAVSVHSALSQGAFLSLSATAKTEVPPQVARSGR